MSGIGKPGRRGMIAKTIVCQLALATALIVDTALTQVNAFGQNVSWLVQFDRTRGQLPESIAINKAGDIFVTLAPIHTIMRVSLDGTASTFAVLPPGTTQGVTTDPEGNLYVLLNTALAQPSNVGQLWRISSDGATQTLLAAVNARDLNALAFDDRGNIYISDSFGSNIYRVDRDGTTEIWVHDPLLAPHPNPTPCGIHPFDPGANGVAFNHGIVYVLNSTQATLIQIPVNPDGSPGTPSIYAGPTCHLFAADGLALDLRGNVYAATNIQKKIVRVAPDRSITTIAAAPADPLVFPSAIAFETSFGLQKHIYITNFAGPGGTPGIVTMDVDIPGQPLP
jgi:sugar lactone lactonase YvrE